MAPDHHNQRRQDMTLNIGISDPHRQGVIALLNTLLADEYVLYTKTRNYHWNVTGLQFNDLHKFFEAQYEALDDIVDEVAERARSLGGRAAGTLEEFRKHTRLNEEPGTAPAAKDMLAKLLADHEALVRTLRADVDATTDKFKDVGTADFLTGLLEQHEKMAWMLRAFLG
jgi:starvation-inducible DNA-binding protein